MKKIFFILFIIAEFSALSYADSQTYMRKIDSCNDRINSLQRQIDSCNRKILELQKYQAGYRQRISDLDDERNRNKKEIIRHQEKITSYQRSINECRRKLHK